MTRIYVEVNAKDEVVYSHNFPFDEEYGLGKTEEQLEKTGFLVQPAGDPEIIEGKRAVLKVNRTLKTLYHDYVTAEKPVVEESELDKAKKELSTVKTELADLTEIVNDLVLKGAKL